MNRLREKREEKNLTLKETTKLLSDKKILTITPDGLAKYERGKRKPDPDVWQKLADFFGVSVDWLKGYGYSREELAKLLSDGYDESFTYQHSRDLDNKIMDAIAEKTGNKIMQSMVQFQKEHGNLKRLLICMLD